MYDPIGIVDLTVCTCILTYLAKAKHKYVSNTGTEKMASKFIYSMLIYLISVSLNLSLEPNLSVTQRESAKMFREKLCKNVK